MYGVQKWFFQNLLILALFKAASTNLKISKISINFWSNVLWNNFNNNNKYKEYLKKSFSPCSNRTWNIPLKLQQNNVRVQKAHALV